MSIIFLNYFAVFVFSPLNKKLYAHTLDTFPAAQTLLAASVCALAGLVNLALFTKRDLLRKNAEEVKAEQQHEDMKAEEADNIKEAGGGKRGQANHGIQLEEWETKRN